MVLDKGLYRVHKLISNCSDQRVSRSSMLSHGTKSSYFIQYSVMNREENTTIQSSVFLQINLTNKVCGMLRLQFINTILKIKEVVAFSGDLYL
jgi:hypothetical protein